MLELFARVEAILRRTKKDEDTFVIDNVRVEFHSRRLFLEDEAVEYTPKEFELLEVLIRNRNIALSREKLLELVWGYEFLGETRTVDVHIQKLRRKLGLEKRIVTVYKLGYRLEV
jgi:DNA-binding response OmpR family regulator